jgi:glycosyltransferase involved in cell wall biosynthesis
MKILFIVPNPPSLVRVRPYNLIRYLAAHGHEVTVATVWSNAEEWQDIQKLKEAGFHVLAVPLGKSQILQNLLGAALTGKPLQASYCSTPTLRSLLADILNSNSTAHKTAFDVVHVEHLRGAQYGLFIQDLHMDHPLPMVWDSVDCISHLFRQAATSSRSQLGRIMAKFELGSTRRYESELVNRFDQVTVTSVTDKNALETLGAAHESNGHRPPPISVLPNGVDLNYFDFKTDGRDPATILLSGKMSYHANVTAAFYLLEEIMPRIWQKQPEAKAVIAGKDPPAALLQWGEKHPNVEVTGTVPDLRPYLHAATVSVSPVVYGAGIQNKVLEAMACGTPVITSMQAASALQAQEGKHLLVADCTDDFVHHLLQVLPNRTLQRSLSLDGRRYVEQFHNWDRIVCRLEHLYCQVIERKKPQ